MHPFPHALTAQYAARGREGMMGAAPRRVASMTDPYETAFLAAFDEYADALFRHALFRISDRERAADLTQETFLKAWDHVRGGGEVRHYKAFLYRILHNLIVDEYRKRRESSLDALAEDDPATFRERTAEGGRAETEEALDAARAIARLRELIPLLPEAQRTAVSLRYVDGFSPKEIAKLLDISENVASVRIHRGVAQLKHWCGPIA